MSASAPLSPPAPCSTSAGATSSIISATIPARAAFCCTSNPSAIPLRFFPPRARYRAPSPSSSSRQDARKPPPKPPRRTPARSPAATTSSTPHSAAAACCASKASAISSTWPKCSASSRARAAAAWESSPTPEVPACWPPTHCSPPAAKWPRCSPKPSPPSTRACRNTGATAIPWTFSAMPIRSALPTRLKSPRAIPDAMACSSCSRRRA